MYFDMNCVWPTPPCVPADTAPVDQLQGGIKLLDEEPGAAAVVRAYVRVTMNDNMF